MGLGPEDIYYEIDGELVCSYDLGCCSDWDEVEKLVGPSVAAKAKEAGYEPDEVWLWLDDSGYEQKIARHR